MSSDHRKLDCSRETRQLESARRRRTVDPAPSRQLRPLHMSTRYDIKTRVYMFAQIVSVQPTRPPNMTFLAIAVRKILTTVPFRHLSVPTGIHLNHMPNPTHQPNMKLVPDSHRKLLSNESCGCNILQLINIHEHAY